MKKIYFALLCTATYCSLLNAQGSYTYTQIVEYPSGQQHIALLGKIP